MSGGTEPTVLFTVRVFVRNLLRANYRRNIFFIFCFVVWRGVLNCGLTSNKPIHCLLDQGDFILDHIYIIWLLQPFGHNLVVILIEEEVLSSIVLTRTSELSNLVLREFLWSHFIDMNVPIA